MMGMPEFIWMLASGLVFFGFWAVVIIVLVRLIRRAATAPTPSAGLRILEERYARGEISEQEFLERRAVLEGSR